MHAQSRLDWARFAPAAIPTKPDMPHVGTFISALPPHSQVLDIGCGAGAVTHLLLAQGLSVVGLDINGAAIAELRRTWGDQRGAEFHECDVASPEGFGLGPARFDAAICQLVASVVGDAQDRAQLLRNTYEALRPGGSLSISFSGLSDDINPQYAELYARDAALTGEHGSYLSRDDAGRVLYRTHHFSADEIERLLHGQGLRELQIAEQIEASSRRPDQRARFFYVTCRRG